MRLILKRISESPSETFGVLINAETGLPICVTLELPFLQNRQNVSAIPTGTYVCKSYSSKNHNEVYQITNVPGRSGILFHKGNTVTNILGCILVGSEYGNIGSKPAVLNSAKAMQKLKAVVLQNPFILTVKSNCF